MIELAIIGAGVAAIACYGLVEQGINWYLLRRRMERRIRRIGR